MPTGQLAMQSDILVTNANALVIEDDAARMRKCDVVIRDGIIVDLPPAGAAHVSATDVLDADGGLVIPGLINAHTHSPENLKRGHAEKARLQAWLNEVWRDIDALSVDDVALAVEWGAAEMIRHGVTGVVDHFRQTPVTEEALVAAVESYGAIGMRAMLAVMLRDGATSAGGVVGVPHVKSVPSAADQISLVADAYAFAQERGVQLAFGPSAPHRCSDRLLEGLALAGKSICIHTHVDETEGEVAASLARFGRSEIAHLDRLGLLGPRMSCAHVVHSTPDDHRLLAERGAVVVHNPISNMRLGAGIAPLQSMLDAGVNVALGTDGAASNDSQNIWEVIKAAALLPRIAQRDGAAWPGSHEVLRLATQTAHRVFGPAKSADSAGTLAVGAVADLAVFANDPIDPFDADYPAASLVLGTTSRRARHVVARGKTLLRDGVLTTIDEDRLRRRIVEYRGKHA